jgi:hypothetical protein
MSKAFVQSFEMATNHCHTNGLKIAQFDNIEQQNATSKYYDEKFASNKWMVNQIGSYVGAQFKNSGWHWHETGQKVDYDMKLCPHTPSVSTENMNAMGIASICDGAPFRVPSDGFNMHVLCEKIVERITEDKNVKKIIFKTKKATFFD